MDKTLINIFGNILKRYREKKFKDWKQRMTPNRHDLYKLGLLCATIETTKKHFHASESKIKSFFTSNYVNFFISIEKFLYSETREYEEGVVSNRESLCRGELYSISCTHRPSPFGSVGMISNFMFSISFYIIQKICMY